MPEIRDMINPEKTRMIGKWDTPCVFPLNKLKIEGNKLYLDGLELINVREYGLKRIGKDVLQLKLTLDIQDFD